MDKKAAAGAVAAAVERRTPPRPQLFLQTPKKKTRKKQQQQNHPVPSAFRFQNSNVRIISAEIRRVAVSRAPFCGAHLVPFWNRFGIVAESLRNRAIFDGEGHLLPRQRPADCADGSMNELEGIGWKTTTTTTTTTTTKKEAPKTGSFRWKLFNQKKKRATIDFNPFHSDKKNNRRQSAREFDSNLEPKRKPQPTIERRKRSA